MNNLLSTPSSEFWQKENDGLFDARAAVRMEIAVVSSAVVSSSFLILIYCFFLDP